MQAVTFEKLSGQSNYGTWSFSMEMFLTDLDLWECLNEDFEAKTAEAIKKDAKARSKICLLCSEKIYPLIMKTKTARDTWEALRRAYADGGLLRRLNLLRKLFNVKLTDYSSTEEYVNEIQATSQALFKIKAGLDDEFIAIIMLAGLPEEFNPLVMSLEHSSMKITTETVMAALLKESERKKTTTKTMDSALVSKKDIICHFCKRKGHYKWQCKQRKSKDSKGNVTSTQDSSSKGTAGNVSLLLQKDFVTLLSTATEPMEWVIDSGATSHMTSRTQILENVSAGSSKYITTANNDKIVSKLKGDVFAMGRKIKFEDVLLLPDLITNLLSVSKICHNGCIVVFDVKCCQVYMKNDVTIAGKPLLTAPLKQGLYILDPKEAAMVLTTPSDTSGAPSAYDLWHRRLGHLSGPLMVKLKGMVDGLSFGEVNKEPCVACCQGKQCVKKFPRRKHSKRAKGLLELVHSDLAGPMEVESWGGNRYYLIFVDDYSRKTFGFVLKSKTQVFAKFKEFKALVENQTGKKIKKLRSDNGTEYTSNDFQHYLKINGIVHQTSVPYTPQQNGVSERTIRTVVEKARCMVHEAGLDKKFWGEAVGCAVYLKNRSPTMALADKVPEEVFTGEKVDLSHLKTFGCKAHVLVKDHGRRKFDSKTAEMIMTGYCENQKAYRFINMNNTKRVIFARDATFIERNVEPNRVAQPDVPELTNTNVQPLETPSTVVVPITDQDIREGIVITESSVANVPVWTAPSPVNSFHEVRDENEMIEEVVTPEEANPLSSPEEDFYDASDSGSDENVRELEIPERRYPLRNRRPKRDEDMVYNFHVVGDPVSLKDAMQRSDKNLWLQAMKDEYDSLKANSTWELVDRPIEVNVVKSKWVFKLKIGGDGSVQRHKARLVAKGYSQKPGEDYFETFAPVVRMSSIRLLVALAAEKDLQIHHIDVTTAFLNGELQENIYMEQPECFIEDERKVCKLKKAIYGLKQAARCWNEKIHGHIMKMDFIRSKYDPCVYTKKTEDVFLAIALYVDDFYIFTNKIIEAEKVKQHIASNFKIKDLGEARECLGVRIFRDKKRREIILSQRSYIEKILERYGMRDCKPVSTPVETNIRLKPGERNENVEYQEIIGSLMYLACSTRPDISFAVTMLSQFNNFNNSAHMAALKRVLRYLKGTIDLSLCFKKCDKSLVAYADADWGNGPDGRSFTGYFLMFGGAAVAWQARKQRCVALSTAEAEYIALCEAAKEVVNMKGLYAELTNRTDTVIVFSDSQSASMLVYSPTIGKRSKHINIRYHFVRELADSEVIRINYCQTDVMPADMLTKATVRLKHMFCSRHMGLSGGVVHEG